MIGVPEERAATARHGRHGADIFSRRSGVGRTRRRFTSVRDGEREVADRPDVRATEGGEQINVGGPVADAFEGDEHFAGLVIL